LPYATDNKAFSLNLTAMPFTLHPLPFTLYLSPFTLYLNSKIGYDYFKNVAATLLRVMCILLPVRLRTRLQRCWRYAPLRNLIINMNKKVFILIRMRIFPLPFTLYLLPFTLYPSPFSFPCAYAHGYKDFGATHLFNKNLAELEIWDYLWCAIVLAQEQD
jgi:hypothetical protein